MEVSEHNLNTLVGYLQQTLSPDAAVRKPAEKFIEQLDSTKNFSILLLSLLDKSEVDLTIRVACAITFKNYIKRNWRVNDDEVDKLHQSDRDAVKSMIVTLMLKSPEQIQRQLSDAVSIIGREDFPEKWPNLLQEMIVHFQSGDFHAINGVLHTAHCLFKRYRFEFKSQLLWTEIKFVLNSFARPFMDLFVATMQLAETHASDANAVKIIFSSLVLISKIFYSLNYQDFPEFFEDNIKTWMTYFLKLLTLNNELLKTGEDEEAGLMEELKSQICENIGLYAQKYTEEFADYLPVFVHAVWSLLTTVGQQVKYDLLVCNAIHFLSSVAERPNYTKLFEAPEVLSSICEKVIIPNMEFRVIDEELFEDNPEEYIRRDIEGSDTDTRRRASCDLVKALAKNFETAITAVFSDYVKVMLQNYSQDLKQWKNKDAAIYLVTSMTVKGHTAKHGTTQTNQLVNLTDFYNSHILPTLQSTNVDEFPVLKADCIKYYLIFRNQLSRDLVLNSLPSVINLLTAKHNVVHTYAAHAVERVFTMRIEQGEACFKSSDIQPIAEVLLKNLFATLEFEGSSENEYIMKTIMRTFSILQEGVVPYLGVLLPKLTEKLALVSKNPSRPHFNHYLFETISLSVRIVCKSNKRAVLSFEEVLFPVFENILQQDIQEFIPYVFQLLSLFLEYQESPVPGHYMALFPCLLSPILWERTGNIPALSRLLQAYIAKGAQQIICDQKLSGVLGVFQKLIASKSNDHEGFYILQRFLEAVPMEILNQYIKDILILLFTRLQKSKTTKFIKSMLVFFFYFSYKYSPQSLISLIDDIQPKMFSMVVEKLVIPNLQKVSGSIDRKICSIGMIKFLTETPEIIDGVYSQFWGPLLQTLIGLFELPEDETIPDDEHFIEVEETSGYQNAFCQLMYVGKAEHDPINGQVPDARLHLAHCLQKLSVNQPGKFPALIASYLAPEAAVHLNKYLQAANVVLT